MSIDLYEEQASVIRKTYKVDYILAKRKYENLSNIFIQDSVGDLGEPYYGTSMSRKGNVLFQLQGLFI